MSYGQPWRRMTAGPSAGPASAYPTLSRPASICFIELNDVFVPGFTRGTSVAVSLGVSAFAELSIPNWAALIAIAAVLRKRRRRWLIPSGILIRFIGRSPRLNVD